MMIILKYENPHDIYVQYDIAINMTIRIKVPCIKTH